MLSEWSWIILLAQQIFVFAIIIMILRRPRDPRSMWAWILTLLLLPFIGLVLFFLLGEPRRQWHRRRRKKRQEQLQDSLSQQARIPTGRIDFPRSITKAGFTSLMELAGRLGAYQPTIGNRIEVFHDAAATFQSLNEALSGAQRHIHLEYYLFQADETGREVRDLLIEKARQGVQCRLLLDAIGCWRLSDRFLNPMRSAGIEIAFSLPVIPWRGRWRVNYRNHRKIAIIDGTTGFTGSQNIGDEYSGRLKKFGPWRDTHIKIIGPGVQHLQEVFVKDWYYTTRQQLVTDDYFPGHEIVGNHVVQMVPSGPDTREAVMHQLLFAAVSTATDSICVITPYFVPDTAMILAFQTACCRGVRVRILVPARSNHRVVLWAGRSYYEELVASGVEIYEHPDLMLHSKVMVVDHNWAMVGSANMDERSFRLNFELTSILYSEELACKIFEDFDELCKSSIQMTDDRLGERFFGESVLLGCARLASPLL